MQKKKKSRHCYMDPLIKHMTNCNISVSVKIYVGIFKQNWIKITPNLLQFMSKEWHMKWLSWLELWLHFNEQLHSTYQEGCSFTFYVKSAYKFDNVLLNVSMHNRANLIDFFRENKKKSIYEIFNKFDFQWFENAFCLLLSVLSHGDYWQKLK